MKRRDTVNFDDETAVVAKKRNCLAGAEIFMSMLTNEAMAINPALEWDRSCWQSQVSTDRYGGRLAGELGQQWRRRAVHLRVRGKANYALKLVAVTFSVRGMTLIL